MRLSMIFTSIRACTSHSFASRVIRIVARVELAAQRPRMSSGGFLSEPYFQMRSHSQKVHRRDIARGDGGVHYPRLAQLRQQLRPCGAAQRVAREVAELPAGPVQNPAGPRASSSVHAEIFL